MSRLQGNATVAAVFLRSTKIEENYGAQQSAELYTVIRQIGHSYGVKKLANADILLF